MASTARAWPTTSRAAAPAAWSCSSASSSPRARPGGRRPWSGGSTRSTSSPGRRTRRPTTFQHWAERIGGGTPGSARWGCSGWWTPDRAENLRANVDRARALGANVATQSPADVQAIVPAMAVDDVALGAYEPESGYADAAMTTNAFATRARELGATVAQYVTVEGILTGGDRVTGVRTARARSTRRRSSCAPASGRGGSSVRSASRCRWRPRATRCASSAGRRTSGTHPAILDRPAPHLHAPRDREPHHPRVLRLRGGRRPRPLQRGRGPRRGPEERGADRAALPGHGARALDGRLLRRLRQHARPRAGAGPGPGASGALRQLRLERTRLQARAGGRRRPGPGRTGGPRSRDGTSRRSAGPASGTALCYRHPAARRRQDPLLTH